MILNGETLGLKDIAAELENPSQLSLSKTSIDGVLASRSVVESLLNRGETVYGVNTGFGRLANRHIPEEQLKQLQINLLRSHAAGVGGYFDVDTVRLILLLKINSLARGYSGVRLEVIERLMELYNRGILPAIHKKGSVGASGDLAPLADMALPVIGEGRILMPDGQAVQSDSILKKAGLKPLQLLEKEGLSLINGTQVSNALAIRSFLAIKNLYYSFSAIGAFSTEVLMGTDTAFRSEIQEARNQNGQKHAAHILYTLMQNSGYRAAHADCDRVQDFYSLRCMPQVHGSLYDLIRFSGDIIEREINSTTDNPLTFTETGEILSGGNFHAAPLAHIMDYLAITLSDVATMSERRIAAYQETTQSQLPMFLSHDAGLNSGFMIAHVTAAALTAENKHLAHPASVENIPTSANQEDHVSMAPNSGHKLLQIIENVEKIAAIEYLCAAQAAEFNAQYTLAPASAKLFAMLRKHVPHLDNDHTLSEYIDIAAKIIVSGRIAEYVKDMLKRI